MSCSVLQCVAACCSMLQFSALDNEAISSELQCVAACGSVLQCVAACCSALQFSTLGNEAISSENLPLRLGGSFK